MAPKDYLFVPERNPIVRGDYRPSEYIIPQTALHIDLDAQDTRVRNRMVIERNPALANLGGPLILDGEKIKLRSVRILEGGKWRELDRQEFTVDARSLVIKRPPAGRFELEIETQFNPSENTTLDGIYAYKDKENDSDVICSHCEAQAYRWITYALDRPDVLSTYTVTLEADKEKFPVLLSNGNGDFKKTKDLGNGRHTITWVDPWAKPTYLFAVVAGKLNYIEDTFTTMSGRKVELAVFVQPGFEDKVQWAMDSIKRAMKWDEEKYGREYDLDRFHVAAVDKFNAGACENKGLNIFNVSALVGSQEISTDAELIAIESVIGHEYAHNWTGDRVTVRDWFELSLKESLTSLRQEQFSADMHSHAIATIDGATTLRAGQFLEDAGPSAHSVRPEVLETVRSIYSATVYDKGEHILRMMNTMLGDAQWRKAMDTYFDRFDGQAVTVDDFIDVMQETSGIDLSQFRRWYVQSGTPEIAYEGKYDAKSKTYSLTLKQHTPATADQPLSEKKPLHIPVSVGLIGPSGKDIPLQLAGEKGGAAETTRILHLKDGEQTFVFKNVAGPVVPSILRGFSAPVKLVTQPSDAELIFRMAHDSDPFNRYEAGAKLMLKTIEDLLAEHKQGKKLALKQDFIDAFAANIAAAEDGDRAFSARMLGVPSYGLIVPNLKTVDPDAVEAVTAFLRQTLATTFKDDFARFYAETAAPKGEAYAVSPEQVGRRELHNLSLSYLCALKTPEAAAAAQAQYDGADNMTEKFSALNALSNLGGAAGKAALEDFYQEYKGVNNVIDKWLRLQGKQSVEQVREVMKHEAFDITNPNKVRSLILGGFVAGNPAVFHSKDGSGYKLVADVVIEQGRITPRTALQVLRPLTQFKLYDEARQALMVRELERVLATPDLEKGLREAVSKALASVEVKKPMNGAATPKPGV